MAWERKRRGRRQGEEDGGTGGRKEGGREGGREGGPDKSKYYTHLQVSIDPARHVGIHDQGAGLPMAPIEG